MSLKNLPVNSYTKVIGRSAPLKGGDRPDRRSATARDAARPHVSISMIVRMLVSSHVRLPTRPAVHTAYQSLRLSGALASPIRTPLAPDALVSLLNLRVHVDAVVVRVPSHVILLRKGCHRQRRRHLHARCVVFDAEQL